MNAFQTQVPESESLSDREQRSAAALLEWREELVFQAHRLLYH